MMICPKDIAKKRVLNRNLAGRNDTSDVFEKRYLEYAVNNAAIEQYYDSRHKLIKVSKKCALVTHVLIPGRWTPVLL